MDCYPEAARLQSLRNLRLLDTLPSENFDRITRLVANIFGLPIAAVSLTDMDRQWFKSKVGVEHNEIPRDRAPCAEVAESRAPLVIKDFHEDPYYLDSTLGRAGIRFYAGAPLLTPDGYGLGALCVLGTEARTITENELKTLADLAAMVMDQIEIQHAVGRIEATSGLPNRFQLTTDLADMMTRPEGTSRLISLLDLAHTEQYERLSRVLAPHHLDAMTRTVARLLRDHVGQATQPYQIGPTQFAFLAPQEATLETYTDELAALLRQIELAREFPIAITPSIGLMQFDIHDMQPDDVLRSLQSAVQDARESRSGIGLYSPSTDRRHRRSFTLLQDFPCALEADDQLHLVFQPRIDLATGDMEVAEVLMRWTHPVLGSVPPSEFIPIIESSAFARQLTDWVIEQSLRQLAEWHRQGYRLRLSINVSAANLGEHDFLARLSDKLDRHGVAPVDIELELTETAIMKETDRALHLLRELNGAGIRLAIDDFGTGYSSLAYMQTLPTDVIKIDRSFVADMVNGNRERVLVQSMIDLSHSLGYRVVAEGVETPEAADLLAAMGCEEAQGYWYARPLAGDALIEWIAERMGSTLKLSA